MPRDAYDHDDVVFVNSRREAVVLLVAFSVFLVWSVGTCGVLGYDAAPAQATPEQPPTTIGGMPNWVFWGVAVPWLAANVFTFWFCLFYMKDDPLGEASPEPEAAEAGGYRP